VISAGVVVRSGLPRTIHVPQLQLLEEIIPRLVRHKAAGRLDYVVNFFDSQEVLGRSSDLGVYADATRPAATSAAIGAFFFNTDDGFMNTSDGTNWLDPTGAIT